MSATSNEKLSKLAARLRRETSTRAIGVSIATLLFLRWLDTEEAEREASVSHQKPAHEPVIPPSLQWRSWHSSEPLQRQMILGKLSDLTKSLAGKTDFGFEIADMAEAISALTQLPPSALSDLISWVREQPFETLSDRRSLASQLSDESLDIGEVFIPAPIAYMMARLADINIGDSVYDPSCRGGSLLGAAYLAVSKKQESPGGSDLSLEGIESNYTAFVIGLTRLLLLGAKGPRIKLCDPLQLPPRDRGCDIVLTAPPFGVHFNESIGNRFPIKTDSTGLFIQHALMQLRSGGRAVILVPHGFLFRSGPDSQLRRMLVEQNTVEAVVSLPVGLMPVTTIKVGLLVVRKGGQTARIQMVRSDPFFDQVAVNKHTILTEQHADHFVSRVLAEDTTDESFNVDATTVARTNFDLTATQKEPTELQHTLSLLPNTRIVCIADCCEITSGTTLAKDRLLERPPQPIKSQTSLFKEEWSRQRNMFEAVPYIRIKDIRNNEVSSGSAWIDESTLQSETKLQVDDILVSKSGTIGKVGIVKHSAAGAIVTDGLYILRPDRSQIDPYFLLAYLESTPCKSFFSENSRGAYIRHLNKAALAQLPVPLPPLDIQKRVAAHYRERHEDCVAALTEILTNKTSDLISKWSNDALQYLWHVTESQEHYGIETIIAADLFKAPLSELRNYVFHKEIKQPLTNWIQYLHVAAETLGSAKGVPPGATLYTILKEADHQLFEAYRSIPQGAPNCAEANELTRKIKELVDSSLNELTKNVEIQIFPRSSQLTIGKTTTVDLEVKNTGRLPLKNVGFSNSLSGKRIEVGFLGEQSYKFVPLEIAAPASKGELPIKIDWTATSLDGQHIEGSEEVKFKIVDLIVPEQELRFGGSPYVCGDPVKRDRSDVFFGRKDILRRISRQLTESGNVVLLEGNRRAGKSSILWHLEGPNAIPGWLGVYCSLQGAEGSNRGSGVPTEEVFRAIATSIAKGVQALGRRVTLPNGKVVEANEKVGISKACREGISEGAAFSDFREYLEVILEELRKDNLGVLLMLDEFDKLQQGIDNGITSPQVPENIRYLLQTYPTFSAILTGSRRLKRLREEYWSTLFGLGTRIGVSALDEPAARLLVTEPVKGKLSYSEEAVDRTIYLTARQPYILQCLCNRIFDLAAETRTASITVDFVMEAANAFIEDNEHFASLWGYAGSDRCRLLLALCSRESDPAKALTLRAMQEHLLQYGLDLPDDAIIKDVEALQELELVELVNEPPNTCYRLLIPLMGMWIKRQHNFDALRSKALDEMEYRNG